MSVIKQIDHVLTQLSTFFEDKKLFCILILLLVLCGVYLYFIEIEGFRRHRGLKGRGRSGGGSSQGKEELDAARGNTTKIGENLNKIGTNATKIGTNATKIGTNATKIGTNATKIGTNATKIGTNATKIGKNATKIGKNATKIGKNAKNIGENATKIGKNAKNIGENATKIGTIDDIKSLAQNASDLATAADKKASNVKNIAKDAARDARRALMNALKAFNESTASNKKSNETLKFAQNTNGRVINAERRVNDWTQWRRLRKQAV